MRRFAGSRIVRMYFRGRLRSLRFAQSFFSMVVAALDMPLVGLTDRKDVGSGCAKDTVSDSFIRIQAVANFLVDGGPFADVTYALR